MRIVVRRWYVMPAVVLGALGLCNALLLAPLPNWVQSWAGVILAIVLPGVLLSNLLIGRRTGAWLGERFVFAVGMGLGALVTVMLGLSYLPGGLSFAQVVVSLNVVALAALVGNFYAHRNAYFVLRMPEVDTRLVVLTLLMVGAAVLRFTNLGYSELHGDEALVALRANDVIQGWERALFVHKKGPGEILLGTAMWLLTGELTEFAAHLPFAVASWTGVLATYLLGRRWFGPAGGWWAAAMVAVDGYLMAFGRMMQYQSIVFLLTVLTVLAVERARRPRANVTRALMLAAIFLATGLLAHYEAVMAVVPGSVLLVTLWQRDGGDWAAVKGLARQMLWPVVAAVAICAAFYVPFVLDPEFFRDTFAYIFGHRLAGQAAPEVFPTVVGRSTLYSSSYYFWTLVAFTVAGFVRGFGRYVRLWSRVLLTMLLVGAMAALLSDATGFLGENAWLARLIYVALFAPFWFGAKVPAPEKAVWYWFGLPLMAVMFFIAKPGTHVYVFFVPWALLTGMVVEIWWTGLVRWWGAPRVRRVIGPVLAILPVIFGMYVYQLFVRNTPEVLRTWDENRPAGYWTSFETPTFESIFGFPIRNGWKSVASLYAQGELRGRFDTNDRFSMVPDWYLRGEAYCGRDEPNYYFLVPYPLPVDRPLVEQQRHVLANRYYLWGVVMSNGDPHMEIYAREDRVAAEREGAPRTFDAAEFEAFYNENLLDPFTPNGPLGAQPIPNPTDIRFGEQIGLVGYAVMPPVVARGGEVELNLYWRADAPVAEDYFVSVQLIEPLTAAKAGQRDGEPGCNRFPTTTWVAGDTIFDRLFVPVAADAARGEYAVLVKMYNEAGTLPAVVGEDAPSDGVILTTITVE